MQANLYAIGFSVLALGFLPTGETQAMPLSHDGRQAQQLLSHVKTENFYNYNFSYTYETNPTTITEQIYNYNDKNAITDYSSWTITKGVRTLNSETIYAYNDDGKSLSTITKGLDYNTQEISLQNRTDYEYNADGQIESTVSQFKDWSTGDMMYNYKYEYTYTGAESVESRIFYWNQELGDWEEQPPYNEGEIVTESILKVDSYIGGEGLEYVQPKYEVTYNTDSTIITSVYMNWHQRTGKFYNTSRTVSQLNESGFQVSSQTETWNQYCEMWLPSYKNTSKYNSNNAVIQSEYSSWDHIGQEWIMNSRTVSTYIDPKPIIKEEKSAEWGLFPNPSDGDVFIELEGEYTNIEVMNKLGQTVYAERISGDDMEIQLDLAFLPNGNYIVRLENGEDSSSRQIVLQK